MEAGFWNANSRTNEIAFKFGTELTSTSRWFDRFAPEAAVPQMLIPRIERWATGRRKIRGFSNEPLLSQNIDPPLIPQHVQFGLRRLDVARFSLISRCTRPALTI
jgi:hypothetical protein